MVVGEKQNWFFTGCGEWIDMASSADVEIREPGRPTYKTSLWTPIGSGLSEKNTSSGSSKEWLTRVLADDKEATQVASKGKLEVY